MRAAVVLLLLLAGCSGHTTTTQAPLPADFTVTQPVGSGTAVHAIYTINATAAIHLNATLVWTSARNHFDLEVTAGGSGNGQAIVTGTVAHLEHDLYPGTWVLKVDGMPQADDSWHLEVHYTRK